MSRSDHRAMKNIDTSTSLCAELLDGLSLSTNDAANFRRRHDYSVHDVSGPTRPLGLLRLGRWGFGGCKWRCNKLWLGEWFGGGDGGVGGGH